MTDNKPIPGPAAGGAAQLTRLADGGWRIDGDLGLPQVADLARQPAPMAETGPTVLDLAGVGRSSSAAVALLLEWQAAHRACGARLTLINAPGSLCRLAALSTVDALLGLTDVGAEAGDAASGLV
jgi:ABC-type transporter Mla MlaB component